MPKVKSSSKSQKENYNAYKMREIWKTNREKKLQRHLKFHPNDQQAEKATNNIRYRRRKPYKKVWSTDQIKYAQMRREAGLKGV